MTKAETPTTSCLIGEDTAGIGNLTRLYTPGHVATLVRMEWITSEKWKEMDKAFRHKYCPHCSAA